MRQYFTQFINSGFCSLHKFLDLFVLGPSCVGIAIAPKYYGIWPKFIERRTFRSQQTPDLGGVGLAY